MGSRKDVSFCRMKDWEKVRHANVDGNVPVKKQEINNVERGRR